jgi:hypothetical protein
VLLATSHQRREETESKTEDEMILDGHNEVEDVKFGVASRVARRLDGMLHRGRHAALRACPRI